MGCLLVEQFLILDGVLQVYPKNFLKVYIYVICIHQVSKPYNKQYLDNENLSSFFAKQYYK